MIEFKQRIQLFDFFFFCETMLNSKILSSLPDETDRSLTNIMFSDETSEKLFEILINTTTMLMNTIWSAIACYKYVALLSINHLKSINKNVERQDALYSRICAALNSLKYVFFNVKY